MKKYVWLNIETGHFSNSWTEEVHNEFFLTEKELDEHIKRYPESKLITFECLTDKDFEFTKFMKLR